MASDRREEGREEGSPAMNDPRVQLILHHLVTAVRSFDPARLDDQPEGSQGGYSYADLLLGIALHDVHHVAQIQLLKRLYDDAHGGSA